MEIVLIALREDLIVVSLAKSLLSAKVLLSFSGKLAT